MIKKMVLFLTLLFLVSCSSQIGSIAKCAEIPYQDGGTEITMEEMNLGFYYGSLRNKKYGTPDDWVHVGEGTSNALWLDPSKQNGRGNDCERFFE